jgi:4a-hydroxytetrahydrobiopterin dehydratase
VTAPDAAALISQRCEACDGSTPRITGAGIEQLRSQLDDEWTVSDQRRLSRRFKFKDFATAFAFAAQIGQLAEQEGHHPDLKVGWGYVEVELTTHANGGLSRNDFILAAKIDALAR